MTRIKYVSVCEYTSGPKQGERFLRFKKGDASGTNIRLATPDNEQEQLMARMGWERVLVYDLPEPMSRDDAKDWIQAERPEPVIDALDWQPAADQRGERA